MKTFLFWVFLTCLGSFYTNHVKADDLPQGAIIRDSEIEQFLRNCIDPIFKVAGLNPSDLRLLIVVSKEVNAFATFNTTICLFTGFLLKTENLSEVIGVLAHEIGHLAGHHVIALTDAIENAQKMSLFGMLAGATLGILTGRPDLILFPMMGGNTSAQYNFSYFSRGQESTADRMAVRFLNELCWSTEGLESFLKKLLSQELLRDSQQDPYLRSHPLTQERVSMIDRLGERSCCKPFPQKMMADYNIMKMKLDAYISPASVVLERYRGNTFLDRYAQVIAYHRLSDSKRALNILDGLLLEETKNAFLWELKAQILYENGQIQESVQAYERAVKLNPNIPLLLLGLAQSLVGLEKKYLLPRAQILLEKVKEAEPDNLMVLQYLSIVYGRLNKMGQMALALAEKEAFSLNWEDAKKQATRALQHLKRTDKSYLKAQDIKNQAELEMNKKTQTEAIS